MSTQKISAQEELEKIEIEFFKKAITHFNGGGFIKTGRDKLNYRDTETMWIFIKQTLTDYGEQVRREQIEKDAKIAGSCEIVGHQMDARINIKSAVENARYYNEACIYCEIKIRNQI